MVAVGCSRGALVTAVGIGVSAGWATAIQGVIDGLDAGTVTDVPGDWIVGKNGGGAAIGTQALNNNKVERNSRLKTGFMVKECRWAVPSAFV